MILPKIDGLTAESIAIGFDRFEKGDPYPFGEPSKELEACAREIWDQYPPLNELTDDQIEESVWSCDHDTLNGFIHMAMFLRVQPSTLNFITNVAHKHGLAVFDPQFNSFQDTYNSYTFNTNLVPSVILQIASFLNNLFKIKSKHNEGNPTE